MYKRGHDYDYQYDWVLKKSGQQVNTQDYADAKPTIAGVQGKMDENPPKNVGNTSQQKFIEERKENRANLGQQVVNNGTAAAARQ